MSDQKMQGLSFEIKAESSSASTSIDNLIEKLDSLQTKLKFNVDDSGLAKLKQLAASATSSPQLKGFIRTLKGMNGIRVSAVLGKNTKAFVDALDSLTNDTVDRWEALKQALTGMPSMKVTGSTGSGTVDFKKKVDNATPKTSSNVDASISGSGDIGDATEKAKKELTEVEKAFRELKNAGQQLETQRVWERWANEQAVAAQKARSSWSYSAEVLKEAFSGINERVSQLRQAGLDTLIQRWNASMKSAASSIGTFAKKMALLPMSFGKRMIASVKQTTSALGNFISSIKRIAFYRLIRSALKAITQGFAEGQKNLYQYSKLMGTQFAESMDKITSQSLYLKNSLAAMAAPLINAITPAIEFVIDKIVVLFNWINKVISALSGKTVTTVAKRVTKEFDDAAGKAGGSARKAADELKRTILAFDELNVLNDANSRSGGGGGGSGSDAEDYASMFEEVAVDDWFKELKKAFENGAWDQVGRMFGKKLNGLVDKFDAKGLGKKIGGAIDAAVKISYGFLSETNFTNIGKKIMQLLNSGISSISWEYVGRLPVKFVTSVFDLILGAVAEWDPKVWAKAVSDFIVGGFSELGTWFSDKDWHQIGMDLERKIADFLIGIDWLNVLKTVVIGVFEVLKGLLQFADGLLAAFFKDLFSGLGGLLLNLLKPVFQALWLNLFVVTGLIDTKWGEKAFAWGYDLIDKMGEGMEANSFEGALDQALDEAVAGMQAEIPVIPSVDKKTVAQVNKSFYKASVKDPFRAAVTMSDSAQKAYNEYELEFERASRNNPAVVKTEVADNAEENYKQLSSDWVKATAGRRLGFDTKPNDNGVENFNLTKTYFDRAKKPMTLTSQMADNGKEQYAYAAQRFYAASKPLLMKAKMDSGTGTTLWNEAGSQWNSATRGKALVAPVATDTSGKELFDDVESSFNKEAAKLKVAVGVEKKLTASDIYGNTTRTLRVKVNWKEATNSDADKAIRNAFGVSKIPTFQLAAKGGIVDGATLIGGRVIAGEAGKEAIVPLERNTEWMDDVAARIGDDDEDVYASMLAALNDWYQTSMRGTMTQIADDTRRSANNGGSMSMSGNDITAALARKNLRDGRTVVAIG